MKNKLFIILIFFITITTLSVVSASDNLTDSIISDEGTSDLISVSEDDNMTPVVENITKTTSKISVSSVTGYESFTSDIKVKLTSNNTPLSSKKITINLNGKTYTKTTDKTGQAILSLKLSKGTYKAQFLYFGDNYTSNASAQSTITIKSPQKTTLSVGDKYINYRQGSKCLFYVVLKNNNGKAIKNQIVTIKVNGKTFNVKTDKNGYAKIFINLKKGKYKIKYSFKKISPYLASSGYYKITVKSKMTKGNGYWLWSEHMKSVNIKSLSKKGTKQILLHVKAISQHGKSAVVSFIKKAHKFGIKVHLWMQICYSGGKWVRPVNKDGSIKYSFLNKKIKEAKSYAKIRGVDGIHFDYVRFGGTAHLYKTSAKAINYFVKKASTQIHKFKSNCIVSAAVMPEPSMMLYYYGQDIPTMSRYIDVIIPMVYKGNYGKTTSWVKSVTKTFVSQSNGAQLWTGLQSYHSDKNIKKLSQSSLLKDAKAAKSGGATGIMLFRIGISCNFNFLKVKI